MQGHDLQYTCQATMLQTGVPALMMIILAFYNNSLCTKVHTNHTPYFFPHPHPGSAGSLTIQM